MRCSFGCDDVDMLSPFQITRDVHALLLEGNTEIAGLDIAGLDNGGLDIDGLDNGGQDIDGLDNDGLMCVGNRTEIAKCHYLRRFSLRVFV